MFSVLFCSTLDSYVQFISACMLVNLVLVVSAHFLGRTGEEVDP